MPNGSDAQAGRGKMAVDFDKGWTAGELADHAEWLFTATQQEQRALIELAQQIEAQIGGDPNRLLQMRRADFDLGPLAGRLDAMMQEIRERSGVVLYRGLPMDALSRLGTAILYWALGVHLGTPQSNNPEGDMIGHVVNIGADYKQPNQRGYQTAVEMDYHCDQTDLVGLLCIHEAKSGGLSKITSSRLLYHTLQARRPDLVAVLCQPFCWTKHAETGSREKPYYESPVFNFTDGILSTSFGPTHIFKGHQLADAPDMTAVQKQAIEAAWALADELHYAMRLQRGDIQLVNNYKVLHTRTAFEDWPDPARRRTLWRLWLQVEDFMPRTPYSEQWLGGVAPKGTAPRITLNYQARTTG